MRNAGLPEETRGPAGFRGVVQQFRRASPDIEWTVEHLLATGDMMSLHYTVRGTHEGELIGSPATGTGVELEGMTLLRYEAGKAVEGWRIYDALGVMR
jgi:predicted ester cyclase